MEILIALEKVEEIERKASSFYKKQAVRFFDNTEAALVFFKMHIEEMRHMNLVRYVRRLVGHYPEQFTELDYPEDRFIRILAVLEMELAEQENLSLEEAINVAENLETVLSEGYLTDLPTKSNPILQDLYDELGDTQHAEMISEFRHRKIGP